ncbi:MAG: TonB-dependent receptor, partial [Caulobacterales bacterium]|nr:TonB-dependent receptor [Caulobacterales bacterium]
AGIVKFDSRKPTEEIDGYATVSYGSFDSVNFEGAVGGPLVPGVLSARASVLSQNRGDWIDNAFTGENDALGGYNELAGRIQLLYTPNDSFSALGNIHARTLDGTAAVFRANILTTGGNDLNENFDRDTVFFDGGDNNPQEYDGLGGSLKLEYQTPANLTLSSITGIETTNGRSRGDIDGGNLETGPGFIPFPSDTQDSIDQLQQITQEVRVASEYNGPFNWQAGGYYFTSEFDITTQGPGFPPLTTLTHENDLWAVFGQASYDLTEQLTVSGGVRFTEDEKSLVAVESPLPTDPVNVSDEEVSWDISGLYAVSPDVSLFARVARGFRGPTIQGRDIAFFGAPSVADSETSISYEGGVKTQLFNGRARFNATGFYYEVSDLQLSAVGGAGNLIQLVNADQGVGYGIELEGEAFLTDNLFVTGGFGWNDTELQDPDLEVGPCGSGQCTPLDPDVDDDGFVEVDGNPFPQAPEFTINFTARYGMPFAGGELFAYTDWFYQGETNLFLYESEEFFSDGNFEGGLRLGYAGTLPAGQSYEAAVFARNITDEENLVGGIDFNNNTGFVNEPRVIGVSLQASLN